MKKSDTVEDLTVEFRDYIGERLSIIKERFSTNGRMEKDTEIM